MWAWLVDQAQGAGGFVAVFSLLVAGGSVKVCHILWKQLLSERSEHRKAETASTAAINRVAGAMEKMAAKWERART